MTTKFEPLASEVLSRLKKAHLTLATAESCTGGLVGKLLTDIPGSSAVYLGGVISYTNGVKHRLLGVQEDTLRVYTAVSRQTAHEMALGAREATGASIGVSVTGLAGPDSDETGREVGLVYIAIDLPGVSYCKQLQLPGDREAVRNQAAEAVLKLILEFV